MRIKGTFASYDSEKDELTIYRNGDVNDKILLLGVEESISKQRLAWLMLAKKGQAIEIEFVESPYWKIYMVDNIPYLSIEE